jgi:hypothetical protein
MLPPLLYLRLGFVRLNSFASFLCACFLLLTLQRVSFQHENKRRRQVCCKQLPSLSHLLISTKLIADLPAMSSGIGYTTEESGSSSGSESDPCIRDHGDEAADPPQGNSPEICCIYIFLYSLQYITLQLFLRLFSSSFILLLNDIFTNTCGHFFNTNFVWHRKSNDVFCCLT